MKSIKEWAEEDRPREKMLLKGAAIMTNAELVAILLGSGSREESAVQLARRILDEATSLEQIGKKPLKFFTNFKGIGTAKAITLMAALELGRRRQLPTAQAKQKVTSSSEAYRILGPVLRDLSHEECWIVCLNRANIVISKEKISTGGISGTIVDGKLVFSSALNHGASAIVLYHNHPSGEIRPSRQDIELTKNLVQAGNVMDILVHDHLIIGGNKYFSFRDEGLIDQ